MAKKLYEESSIQAIADAIREKNGETTTYKPSEMAAAITAITTGGGGEEIPEEAFLITGNCQYRFSRDNWNWFIKNYSNKITTKDITDMSYMFYYSQNLEDIPFDINLSSTSSAQMNNVFNYCTKLKHIPNIDCKRTASQYADMSNFFVYCYNLTQVPYLYNASVSAMTSFFGSCYNLREIPEDYFDTWIFDRINNYAYAGMGSIFQDCRSLRKLPTKLFRYLENNIVSSPYSYLYYSLANGCYVLDEITDLPISTVTYTSNFFLSTAIYCFRLKRFTFVTNEDGTAKTAKWKNQTIDLTMNVGFYDTNQNQDPADYATDKGSLIAFSMNITDFNSGITVDKAVYDDTTYQALKNDPDWFCLGTKYYPNSNYSRYNHDSAVETINSLPDTSAYLATAGGTNTIKFYGASGSATDGGAINTLTEEEIAVAAAKGWTVTLS